MIESEIQKQILVYLDGLNYVFAWKSPNQGMRVAGGRRIKSPILGLPDITGYHRTMGKAIFIEVKTLKGKVSDAQRDFLSQAVESGCIAFVARSLDDVTEIFPVT